MILLTGGTSFNAKEFVHDYVGEIIILQHLNKKQKTEGAQPQNADRPSARGM